MDQWHDQVGLRVCKCAKKPHHDFIPVSLLLAPPGIENGRCCWWAFLYLGKSVLTCSLYRCNGCWPCSKPFVSRAGETQEWEQETRKLGCDASRNLPKALHYSKGQREEWQTVWDVGYRRSLLCWLCLCSVLPTKSSVLEPSMLRWPQFLCNRQRGLWSNLWYGLVALVDTRCFFLYH